MNKKYIDEKDFILEHVLAVCKNILSKPPSVTEEKASFDIVTNIDLEIEKYLIAKIKSRFPEDSILSEEFNSSQKIEKRTWTIDPIDGTANFSQGSPLFGIQTALIENNEVVMSVIVLPVINEIYYAIKGEGSFLNGKRIEANKNASLNRALVSFGDFQHNKPFNAVIQHSVIGDLRLKVARIRMFGSACIDLSFVGAGKTDATVIVTKNLWDIAPGLLIAKEAGAVITNIYGGEYVIGDVGVIASANNLISKEISELFNKYDSTKKCS